MSRETSICCDGCGKRKQAANHWWVVRTEPDSPSFGLAIYQAEFASALDLNAAVQPPDSIRWYDFCGRECALKFISEQMGKQA